MDHEAGQSLAHLQRATARLLTTTATMSDAQAREPSLLPGWTRGHVLTHIARNADAIGNLLRSARTGTPIPMYPSQQVRDGDIEAGSGRPSAALLADLRASAGALEAEAASLPDEAWPAMVHTRRGDAPARSALLMRLAEVEIHHVDLGFAYRPGDWPASFAPSQVGRVAAAFSGRAGVPDCLLLPEGADPVRIGPVAQSPAGAADGPPGGPLTVSGPAWAVLAWLISRGDGSPLSVDPPGALPVLPPWA